MLSITVRCPTLLKQWCMICCFLAFACMHAEDVVQTEPEKVVVNEATVLARVNGEAITLRALEDDLMRQEGSQVIEDLLRSQLAGVHWNKYKDPDIIVKVADIEVPRVLLINQLLEKYGAEVREQMIQAAIIKQALVKDGLVLDAALKRDILERMKRKHRQDQEASGSGTVVPFESAIQDKYGKTLEEWTNDPAFLTLAGMYALLYKRTEIADAELLAYYTEHLIRYAKPEAYEIAVLPFHFKGEDGQPLSPEQRVHVHTLAGNTYKVIKSKKRSFASLVRLYDQQFSGERGFVDRSGHTEVTGTEMVPAEVMEAVFRHQYESFPTVLGVIEAPGSLSIVEVRSYRDALRPEFETIQNLVKRDLIDDKLDTYLASFIRDLKGAAEIDYTGLLEVLDQRRKDLAAYLEQRRKQLLEELETQNEKPK